MPRSPRHALIWSQDHARYELSIHGQVTQQFRPEDEPLWLAWLETVTSFAFHGQASHLNVYQEARSRGGVYWYAYHTTARHTRKRYLGRTARVTFARLEQEAEALETELALASKPPLPEAEQQMTLLVNKLSHPLLPSLLVPRERLLSQLDAALSHPLTLLSASAGWGKTTLLSTWAACSAFPIAWLSLDELDNDPVRFWVSVLAALRTCLPGVGEIALAMLRSPQSPRFTTVLTTLMNEMSSLAQPIVLLLDDYQVIEEPAIHDALLFLLEHLPIHLHLVLASRIDPPLALERLRVRGHLLELRDADLRFQEVEAAHFLTHTMHLTLAAEDVAILARRTEGWIAGLQLAALSMRQHQDLPTFVRGFSGSHHYLLDYVQEEILKPLPIVLQNFLLHTSILRRMTASLSRAVTTQTASQELLKTLERANLFLIPLDEERHWYRVHDLFREALLARLYAAQPEIVPILHQRAARWHEEQGELQEAIEHLFAAKDYAFAAQLLERTAEQFWLRGEITTLCRWIRKLPDAVVHKHARMVLTSALYLLNTHFLTTRERWQKARIEVEQIMMRVETVLRQRAYETDPSSSNEMALLKQRLRLLSLWIESGELQIRADLEHYSLIDQQMHHLEQEDEVIWQMIPLSVTFILHYTLLQQGGTLVPLLQQAKLRVSQSGDRYALVKVEQWLVLAYGSAGQLHLALQESLTSLALLEQMEGYTLLAGYFSISLASTFYEWNRLEEARNALHKVLPDAVAWQHSDLQMVAYYLLMKIELVANDLTGAYQALQEAEKLVMHRAEVYHRTGVMSMRVRWWLAEGNLAEASAWAAQIVFRQDAWEPFRYEEFQALIHVTLAQRQYHQAVEILERFSFHLDRPENIENTIVFLSLYVVALYQAGRSEHACLVALRLLAFSESGDYLRTYLDMGDVMREVLQILYNADSSETKEAHDAPAFPRSYVSWLLTAFAEEKQRRASRTEEHSTSVQTRIPQILPRPQSISPGILSLTAEKTVLEPLSSQEQRVLCLLVVGQTYTEMAETLIVSRNTIKTQVSSIYRKLGVSRRAEAIASAQRWRLL